jgi:hypothetical protein
LERIQKFNEEKLMKDLEQLEKKNQNVLSNKVVSTSIKRKVGGVSGTVGMGGGMGSGEKKSGVNYEERIRELEAKLFGR